MGGDAQTLLTFNVPRQEEGIYNMDLGMRVFQNYPYKSITLIVERTVIRTQHKKANKSKLSRYSCVQRY